MLRMLATICAGALLLLAACSGGEDADETQPRPTLSAGEQPRTATVPAVETVAPQLSPTPLPTPPLTGIGSVDAAIEAILADDGDALVAQMRMTSLVCEATPTGLQPHPGCESNPAGTLTEGFPISSCEGRYADREFAEPLVRGYAGQEVHSVFAFPGTRLHRFLSAAQADYILIVQRLVDGGIYGSGLLLNSDGVVGQVGGCQQTPAQAIASWELIDPIIPPPQDR